MPPPPQAVNHYNSHELVILHESYEGVINSHSVRPRLYCPCLDACVDTYSVFGHGGQPRWTSIGFIFKDVVSPHVGVVQTITMPR